MFLVVLVQSRWKNGNLFLAGVKNILSKMLGSSNKVNNVKAVFEAFKKMKTPEQMKRRAREAAAAK